MHLARIGSFTRVARTGKNPPLTTTGKVRGAISTAEAPARSIGFVAPAGCPC
jgi:hypothetical protein